MRFSAQDPEASQKAVDDTRSSDYRHAAVLKLTETLLPMIQQSLKTSGKLGKARTAIAQSSPHVRERQEDSRQTLFLQLSRSRL